MSWGKRKNGQAYPKNKTSGVKKAGSTSASGIKIAPKVQHKKIESHLYRIYQYTSSEYDSDRDEIAHVRAKDIDQATEFVKKKYFAKNVKDDEIVEDGDGEVTYVSVTYAVNENGGTMHQKTIDRLEEEGKEDEINWVTEGFQIEENDDIKEDFETIMGGNDFFDITGDTVVTHGQTTEQALHEKKGGFNEATFFGINRINQKIREDAIRETYRKKMDFVNNWEMPEAEKKLMLRTFEEKMNQEIKEIGRIPMNDVDYGTGDGVK